MIIEFECMTCGDHAMLDADKKTICTGCDNGVMQPYKKDDISGLLL